MKRMEWSSADQPRVINLGIELFYEALLSQQANCVQIAWQPPPERSAEIDDMLDQYL